MFENKHSITLLFNANKIYDRRIIAGVGDYLQTSKVDWDLYLEEDFMARLDHLDEWSGDGIIADYDNPEIQAALHKANVPVVGIGGSYENPADYPDVPYVATDNYALIQAAFEHLRQKGIQRFAFYGAPVNEHHRWAKERENLVLEITRSQGYE
ncbi:MAG TPA: XylR family transcriptional regulator, partial [Alteromonas sp.]|nr:XylR family transcriptional regulator [Alteromonas sp.]